MRKDQTRAMDNGPSSGPLEPSPPNLPRRRQNLTSSLTKLCLWFPVAFVLGIIIYGYYVFVVEYCSIRPRQFEVLKLLNYDPPLVVRAVLYMVIVNFLILLLLINFLTTALRSPGSPTDFHLERAGSNDELVGWQDDSGQGKSTFILPSTDDRYCGICDTPKPERCHHCSVCAKCRLKMDHHCPWFNNCIGYRNYKFFLLTLFYSMLACTFIFATLLQELIWELANDKTTGDSVQFLIICIFTFVLGASSIVLFLYHLFLVGVNATTLEHMDRTDPRRRQRDADGLLLPNPYDVGLIRNMQQVISDRQLCTHPTRVGFREECTNLASATTRRRIATWAIVPEEDAPSD